ncbi:TFIIB-type domain-containing protein, partial [Haematococcus lacustris]
MEGQKCPRCGDADLEVDDQDGFLLCRACGFVAEDLGQLGGGPEPGTGGVYVGAEDDGSRAAGALSAAMSSRYHPDAGAAGGSSTLGRHVGSRGKGAMEAAEKLKGLGSTLGLPQRVIADAVAMLAEVRDGRLVHVGGPMNTGDAQLAGLLFLAARSASLPLTLSRAASAAQADRHAAGTQF